MIELKDKKEVNTKIFIDRNYFKSLLNATNSEAFLIIDYLMKRTSEELEIHFDKFKVREIFMFGSFQISDKKEIEFSDNLSRVSSNSIYHCPIIDFKLPNKVVEKGYRESAVDNTLTLESINRIEGPTKADVSIFITGDSDLAMLPNYLGNKTVPVLARFNIPEIERYTSSELSSNFSYVVNFFEDLTKFKFAFSTERKSGILLTVQPNTGFISSPNKLAFNSRKDENSGKNVDTPNFYFYKENSKYANESEGLNLILKRGSKVHFDLKFLYNVKEQRYQFCAVNVE